RFEIEERSQDLLAEHRAEWMAHLPRWAQELKLTFRRGLPEVAGMTASAWLRHGVRLSERVPVRRLELTDGGISGEVAEAIGSARVAELSCNHLGSSTDFSLVLDRLGVRLRRLELSGDLSASNLCAGLLRWPGLTRLTGLEIHPSESG